MMKKLYVLVACEESQTSCIAFRDLGCIAFSCDIRSSTGCHPEWHICADVLPLLNGNCYFTTEDGKHHHIKHWDLLLAHPPCTYLSASCPGIWSLDRLKKTKDAADFFYKFYNCSVPHICVENPRPRRVAGLPLPDCVVSPFMFGSPYSKRTYLWLRNLPPIIPTCYYPNPISYHDMYSGSFKRSKSDPIMYREIARQFVAFLRDNI